MAGAAGGCVSAAGSLGGRLRSAAPVSRDGTGYRPAAAVRAAAPSRTAHLLAGSAAPGGPAAATVAHLSRCGLRCAAVQPLAAGVGQAVAGRAGRKSVVE